MNVTVIDAGNIGHTIGTRAVAGGHEVEIVDRDRRKRRRKPRSPSSSSTAACARSTSSRSAARSSSSTSSLLHSRSSSRATSAGAARSSSTREREPGGAVPRILTAYAGSDTSQHAPAGVAGFTQETLRSCPRTGNEAAWMLYRA